MLSANAGSGKTSVLVERFVASVVDDGLRADQVLAITFTEKAAGELRARVRGRLLELGEREAARQAEGAWITTFHGFCMRILRAHAVAAGLDPAFAVLDAADGRAAQRTAFDAALADFLAAPRADALDLAAAYTVDRLERMVVGAHEALRSRGQTRPSLPAASAADAGAARAALERACASFAAELAAAGSGAAVDAARDALAACRAAIDADVPIDPRATKVGRNANALKTPAADAYRAACEADAKACADVRAVPALALVDELLGRYADAYAAAKRARAGVDFDDLQLLARDLLAREPGIAAGYRDRFERIMVDEFQDTNPLQLELLELVARDNACTVGDELQAIYAFRHADVEVFRARRSPPGGDRPGRDARDQLPLAPGDPAGAQRRVRRAPRALGRPAPGPRRPSGPGPRGRVAGHRRGRLERRRARRVGARAAGRQRGQAGRGAARGPARRRAGARGGRRAARRRRAAARRDRDQPLRARARARRPADAGGRRRRVVGAPADPRPVPPAGRAGQPARRGGAARRAGLAHGRAVLRRARAPGARRARGCHDDLGRGARRRPGPGARGRAAPARLPRVVRRRAPARPAAGARRDPPARRCAGPATTCTCSPCRAARGAWPTSTSCCGWRRPSRRAAGATCAASSTWRPPSSRPTRASPTRRSTSAASTPSGS